MNSRKHRGALVSMNQLLAAEDAFNKERVRRLSAPRTSRLTGLFMRKVSVIEGD